MKMAVSHFLVVAFLLCSCASEKETVAPPPPKPQMPISQELGLYSCPNGQLQGIGTAGDYNLALDMAVSQIAVQIQSTVKSVNISKKTSDVAADGNETITEKFQTKSQVSAEIRNRQDVRVNQTLARDGVVGVVACMERNDAAKPFRQDYQSARDQLVSTMAVHNTTNHPLEKFSSYDSLMRAYANYQNAVMVLQSLGINDEYGEIEADYRKALEGYNDYKGRYKLYMDGAIETEEGRYVFGEISKTAPLQSLNDSCGVGVVLELEVSDPKCKEGGLGISCSEVIALNGKSCSGETYFTLGGTFKGIGRRDEAEAREKLQGNLSKNSFMVEWLKEIDRWVAR